MLTYSIRSKPEGLLRTVERLRLTVCSRLKSSIRLASALSGFMCTCAFLSFVSSLAAPLGLTKGRPSGVRIRDDPDGVTTVSAIMIVSGRPGSLFAVGAVVHFVTL